MNVGERIEGGRDELDVRGDPHGAEQAAGDRAEEGLGELRVRKTRNERGELAPDPPPALAIERRGPERGAQLRDRLVYEAVIELDALDRVALTALPVAAVEAQ